MLHFLKRHTVTLVSPHHDPDGRLLEEVKQYVPLLKRLYHGRIALSITATTADSVRKALEEADIPFIVQSPEASTHIGDNIRDAFTKALTSKSTHFHYIDFDRALHWIRRFPDELSEIVRHIPSTKGYVAMQRTKRAFETHPLVQKTSEIAVNSIASQLIGRDIDIMSGSFAIDRASAELIAHHTARKDFGIYAEMLEVVWKNKKPISSFEVEGLEWETPDQYQKKIHDIGYTAWLQEFESLSEWEKRVRLISTSTEVLLNETKV